MNMVDITRHLKRNTIAIYLIAFSTAILFILAIGRFSVQSLPLALALFAVIATAFAVVYIFFKNGKLSIQRVVIPLIFVSILLPSIRLPAPIPDVRIELILILIAWMLLILGSLATGQGVKLKWNHIYKWFFLFGVAIFISIAYAALVKGYYPIGRDFFEIAKLLQYFLIFALVASLDISTDDMRKYYLISLSVFLGSALFGFAQYWDLFGINSIISPYYAPTQMRGLLVHGRITGTTPNPNEFGALMVLASSFALVGTLWLKNRSARIFAFLSLGVFVFAVILTLSRSALISLVIAMLFILLIKYPANVGVMNSLRRLLPAAAGLLVLVWLVVQLAPPVFFFRTEQLLDLEVDISWQARIEIWEDNFVLWRESPVFGWGPGKATMTTIVDNEWLLLLRRYGIVGMSIFIFWFVSIYFRLSKIRRNLTTAEVAALTVALQATLLAYAVYMILAAVYHSLQLMPILLLFLGLAYSQSQGKSSAMIGGS